MDVPTAAEVQLFSGIASTDVSVANLSSTIIPQAARDTLHAISHPVRMQAIIPRPNDTGDTRFMLDIPDGAFICDSEYSSFDLTVSVDDVEILDSSTTGDVSAVTLTLSTIDAVNGYITFENAQTGTALMAFYRWSPRRIQGGSTDRLVWEAVLYRASALAWDSLIGPMEDQWVEDYRVKQKNVFRDRYDEVVRKINAPFTMMVPKRKKKLKGF